MPVTAVLGASRAELLPLLVCPVPGADTMQATWDAVCAVAVGGRHMLFWAIEILGHAFRALLDSLFSGKAKTRFLASFLGIVEDSLIY